MDLQYRIHTCKQRLWYVDGYLYPSMVNCGIRPDQIDIWLDQDEIGCLESCMRSFGVHDSTTGGVWYMQDDVVICNDFKERTEEIALNGKVACGFCSKYCADKNKTGSQPVCDMWYSMQCIYLPNRIAMACAKWFFEFVVFNTQYRMWVHAKKYDDSLLWIFMQDWSREKEVINVAPNLVDHVDWLIGGSIVNKIRADKVVRSLLWDDPNDEIVKLLRSQLEMDGRLDENR